VQLDLGRPTERSFPLTEEDHEENARSHIRERSNKRLGWHPGPMAPRNDGIPGTPSRAAVTSTRAAGRRRLCTALRSDGAVERPRLFVDLISRLVDTLRERARAAAGPKTPQFLARPTQRL
jgi:hypothetical protein